MKAILLFICVTLTIANAFIQGNRLTVSIAAPEIKPYAYIAESRENKGLFIQYLNKVTKAEDINFVITIMPWARTIE